MTLAILPFLFRPMAHRTFEIIWFCYLSILRLPDEGYSRNVSYTVTLIYIVYWNVYTMDLIPMHISSGSSIFRLLAYRRQLSQERAVWTKIDIYVLLAILSSCKVLDVCLLNNIIMWLLWFSWSNFYSPWPIILISLHIIKV